jgi:hypothetical protein
VHRSIDTITMLSSGLEGGLSWLEVHRGIWNQNQTASFHIFPYSWFLGTFSLTSRKLRSLCSVAENSNSITLYRLHFCIISSYTVTSTSTVFTGRQKFFPLTVNEECRVYKYTNISGY